MSARSEIIKEANEAEAYLGHLKASSTFSHSEPPDWVWGQLDAAERLLTGFVWGHVPSTEAVARSHEYQLSAEDRFEKSMASLGWSVVHRVAVLAAQLN